VADAIVFDFDGVIVNSEPVHLRAFQAVLAEDGLSLSAREYYERYVGLSDREAFEAVAHDAGVERPAGWAEALMARKTVEVRRVLAEEAPLFPAAASRIRALAAALPLAVASGALRPEIDQVLVRAGIADCFAAIVAAEDTRRSKPAPDPYELAVERLSRAIGRPIAPSRVVAVEDTVQGLASARAAGLRTIAVTTTYPASALEADYVTTDISGITLERVRQVVEA
jgi:HAD superfamily hydrolase (TIGR01509 family)